MPCVASPAANVVACPSAIPTSKKRSGHFFWKLFVPVPDGIAAVIVTRSGYSAASCVRASRNTMAPCGGPGCTGDRVILRKIGLGQREALTLLRDHVHDARARELLDNVERVQHLADVVPVDRPEIAEAERLEKHPGRSEALDRYFDGLRAV